MVDLLSLSYLTTVARWALWVRLASLLLVLVVPVAELSDPATVIAVALIAAWSLVLLAPGGRVLRVAARHPSLPVADVVLTMAVTALVGVDSAIVLATLSTALLVGVLVPLTSLWLVALVLVLSHVLAATSLDRSWPDGSASALAIPLTYVVLAVLGAVVRSLQARMFEDQRSLIGMREETAAARERARLARDMHDSVAKSLHGMALAAAALPTWIARDPEIATVQARAVQAAAEQAAGEARDLLHALRRDDSERPLAQRLRDLVHEYDDDPDVAVRLRMHGVADLPAATADQVLLVLGEALENARRHARCTRVDVRAGLEGHDVQFSVVDDGRGYDTSQDLAGHYGLRGMHERADAIRGRLEVETAPGVGTRVTLTVPPRAVGGTSS